MAQSLSKKIARLLIKFAEDKQNKPPQRLRALEHAKELMLQKAPKKPVRKKPEKSVLDLG